jgi:cellulose synthase operon protein C
MKSYAPIRTPHARHSRLLALILSALVLGIASGCKNAGPSPEASIKKAQAAITSGDAATATIELKNALQTAPQNAHARFLMGQLLLDSGRPTEAEAELRKAFDLKYDNDALAEPFLISVLRFNDLAKLKADAAKLQVTTPANKALVQAMLARGALNGNKLDEAQAAFAGSLALDPKNINAKLGLIELQALKGDLRGAIAGAQGLAQEYPKQAQAHLLFADLLITSNQRAAAQESLKQAIALNPNDPIGNAKLARLYLQDNNQEAAAQTVANLEKIAPGQPGTLYLKAALEFVKRRLPEARELVLNSLKQSPDFAPANALLAQIATESNELSLAEQQAKLAIKNAPNNTQGAELLASVYLKMGAPERAAVVLKPLLEAGIRSQGVLELSAQVASRTNDTAAAQNILAAAANQPNAPAEAKVNLALSKAASGDTNRAIAELESISKSSGKDTDPAALALISTLMAEKQFDKAQVAAADFAQKFPNSVIPQHVLGDVARARGDAPAAQIAYKKAIQLSPKFLPTIVALAELDLSLGNKDAARSHFDKLIQADPKNSDALLGLGRILAMGAGTRAQALDAHKAAQSAAPNALEPALALAQFYTQQNSPAESIKLLEELRRTRPNEPSVLDQLALAYARSGERQKAMDLLETMLKTNSSSAALYFRIGDLRAAMGDNQGALNAFSKAAELQPKALESRVALANLYLRMGRKTEARNLLTQLSTEWPNAAMVTVLAGDFASSDKQYDQAITAYRKALKQQNSGEIARKLHLALVEAKQDGAADELLRSWYANNPQDLGIMMQAGQLKMDRAAWKESVAIFGEILKRQPENVPALNNIAWSLHQLNDRNAKPFAQKALSLEPKSPTILDTLGVITSDQGDTAKGLELIRAAVTLAPTVGEYRVHLAQALFKAGDKPGAIAEVERLLRERPDDPAAPQARELRKQLAG